MIEFPHFNFVTAWIDHYLVTFLFLKNVNHKLYSRRINSLF